jgi:hypothetical protein
LTETHTTLLPLCRFQGAREAVPRRLEEPRHITWRDLSKLSSVAPPAYDQTLGGPGRHASQVPLPLGSGPAVLVTAYP